jgi:hypothetical protein
MDWYRWRGISPKPEGWVQGERSLLASGETAIRCLVWDGFNALHVPQVGDATGEVFLPLAKMVLYYKTHLAA